ncbi:hypothetical protein OH491_20710 [Termitidicoccus mucosus]|uniref:hypothetical protein n=1 Tax=Termitidicoccus mucosus TaxID=1184151 RepID=UPI0011AB6850
MERGTQCLLPQAENKSLRLEAVPPLFFPLYSFSFLFLPPPFPPVTPAGGKKKEERERIKTEKKDPGRVTLFRTAAKINPLPLPI